MAEESQSESFDEGPLVDKVALLLNGTSTGGASLAVSLAKSGADVAVVYRPSHARRAAETKRLVEAEGRYCLIIPAETKDESFSKKVVRRTIETLGRLDIFIDCSDYPSQFVEDTGASQSL
jgi:NAD(P)-dependent dehydrogenase (short-subunit alcohol dehydrogenase family)